MYSACGNYIKTFHFTKNDIEMKKRFLAILTKSKSAAFSLLFSTDDESVFFFNFAVTVVVLFDLQIIDIDRQFYSTFSRLMPRLFFNHLKMGRILLLQGEQRCVIGQFWAYRFTVVTLSNLQSSFIGLLNLDIRLGFVN